MCAAASGGYQLCAVRTMDKRLFLGIDGGGSKTEAAVIDDEQRVLGYGRAGSSNTSFTPRDAAESSFVSAVAQALSQAGLSPGAISAAGCTFASAARGAFDSLGLSIHPYPLAEYLVAFERSGVTDNVGVALTAGTGSSCTGRNAQAKMAHAGGWGAVLGDDGSGYDIGRKGIRHALWAQEGRVPPTRLTSLVNAYFGLSSPREVIRVFTGGRVNQALTAGFAVEVSKAAEEGDEGSLQILEEAGRDLAELALFVARQLFSAEDHFPLVLAGGVFNAGDVLTRQIDAAFRREFASCRIVRALMPPAEAAARIARGEYYRRCQK